jgi:hypothetical protein
MYNVHSVKIQIQPLAQPKSMHFWDKKSIFLVQKDIFTNLLSVPPTPPTPDFLIFHRQAYFTGTGIWLRNPNAYWDTKLLEKIKSGLEGL